MMRKVLSNDPRISTPALSLHKIGKGLFNTAITRVGFDDVILSLLYDDPTTQEGNIGLQHFAEDSKNNLIKRYFVPYSPKGTRFWFFKPKDMEQTIKDHYEFLEPYKRDRHIMKTYNFNKPKLIANDLPRLFDEEYQTLDNMADQIGADDWRDFDLKDYFEDGVSIETPMRVRLWTLT